MPTRHLSDEQRQRYANFAAAPSADQLARYFHLDRSDREVTDGLRGDHNRLGFALMLGSARFIGVFPGADVEIPDSVTAFLVDQLGLKKAPGLNGYFDLKNGQRFRHLALIRERYGFTEFADNGPARFRLTRWLYALCWSGDDHPGPLIERAASWLVVNKVLLPGVSVLERFVGRIRDRAQKRLWKRLVAALDDKQRERIAKLFDEGNESGFAALDALRTVPTQRSSGEFLHHLDRLEAIRAFDLRPSPPKGVPAASLERLARVARAGKPSAIAALQEPRRTATVAALFHTLEAAAQDDAAELAEALITDLVKDAEAADKKARLRSLRDLDDAAILLRDMASWSLKRMRCRWINGATPCSSGFPATISWPRWPRSMRSPGPVTPSPMRSFSPAGAGRAACSSTSPPGWKWMPHLAARPCRKRSATSRKSPTGPMRKCAMRRQRRSRKPGSSMCWTRKAAWPIPGPMCSRSSTHGGPP
jgi:hypothetical protein